MTSILLLTIFFAISASVVVAFTPSKAQSFFGQFSYKSGSEKTSSSLNAKSDAAIVTEKGIKNVALLLGVCLPFVQITSNFNNIALSTVPSAHAMSQQFKLPPIDYKDKNRCKLISSSIGQANAGRDKLYDVRECDLKGQSGAGKDMR